jgi:hypothetical protein
MRFIRAANGAAPGVRELFRLRSRRDTAELSVNVLLYTKQNHSTDLYELDIEREVFPGQRDITV